MLDDAVGRRGRSARCPRLLAVGGLCVAAACALVAPAAARAATTAEAQAAEVAVTEAAAMPAGWTGSSASCTVGEESAPSIDATVRAVNAFRSVAGLGPVTVDAPLSARALAAAAMMRAGNEGGRSLGLSHEPGADWPCFTAEGASGAASSNLALGASGASAVRLYIADEGVASLGHRRWLLDPALSVIGTGSTGMTNAIAVIGAPRNPVAAGTQVAWPPAGAIPGTWVPQTWSISVGGAGESVAFTDPSVTMTWNGAPVAVSQVADLGVGFGTGRTLSWVPSLNPSALRSGAHELTVSIGGASVGGVPVPIAYSTTIGGTPSPATPPPSPAPSPPLLATPPPLATLPGLAPRILRGSRPVRPGRRLTATFTAGSARIVTRYQWLRSGRPIRGAVAVRYRVTRADRGRLVRVRITSQARDGSGVLTETSRGVRVARR